MEPTDNPPPESPGEGQRLARMGSFMEDIDRRIARLSIALGISLQGEQAVIAALHQLADKAPAPNNRQGVERRSVQRHGMDRRLSDARSELRGLLVLRYGVERRFVEQIGVDATRELMAQAETRLNLRGFQPGADGVHLPAKDDSTPQ